MVGDDVEEVVGVWVYRFLYVVMKVLILFLIMGRWIRYDFRLVVRGEIDREINWDNVMCYVL